MKTATPRLAAPPNQVINDLEHRCKALKDKATCRYIVQLEKHYQKLRP